MQIWAGLGNPGGNYALHRHNVGFMAIDTIADLHRFPAPKKAFRSLVSEGRIGAAPGAAAQAADLHERQRLARSPQALNFYKLDLDALTVFHDELDLAPFKLKVKQGGGTAGHNGLRSIDKHLGPDFKRVRIGIGHPGHKDRVTPHVLGNYAKSELEPLVATCSARSPPKPNGSPPATTSAS